MKVDPERGARKGRRDGVGLRRGVRSETSEKVDRSIVQDRHRNPRVSKAKCWEGEWLSGGEEKVTSARFL